MDALYEKGDTYKDIYNKINYDKEGKSLFKNYIDSGYGDYPIEITKDGRIKPLPPLKKESKQPQKSLNEEKAEPKKTERPELTELERAKKLFKIQDDKIKDFNAKLKNKNDLSKAKQKQLESDYKNEHEGWIISKRNLENKKIFIDLEKLRKK